MIASAIAQAPDNRREAPARAEPHHIVVVIPAYNEDRFIGSVVLKARQAAQTVIVVDDGSSDRTRLIAEAAGAVVVRHEANQGKGSALNTGLAAARARQPDVVVFLDADGQHDPLDIPALIEPLLQGQADIVTGSRFLQRLNRAPAYRRFGQRVITALTNATSGVKVTDSWSGFRALSRRAAERVRFQESGWGIEPEIQFQASTHGLVMVDVPVDVAYHEPAKRNPLGHALRTLQGLLRLVGRHRPILLLSGAGMLMGLAGLGAGLWVVDRYAKLHMLPGGIALLSVSLVILGVLTLYTALILSFLRELIPRRRDPDA